MERRLDLNQSGQVFSDGSGPYEVEAGETSSDGLIEVVMNESTVQVEAEKNTVRKTSDLENTDYPRIAATFKNVKTIEGTHYHLKNSLNHPCTNTPFPHFFELDSFFTDRTDFMNIQIKNLISSPEYPTLDQILTIFMNDNLEILKPLTERFSFTTAKLLFNFTEADHFYFGCLTPFDCNLLRTAILTKFKISNCPCASSNSFDMSKITSNPIRQRRTTADSIDEINKIDDRVRKVKNRIYKLAHIDNELKSAGIGLSKRKKAIKQAIETPEEEDDEDDSTIE